MKTGVCLPPRACGRPASPPHPLPSVPARAATSSLSLSLPFFISFLFFFPAQMYDVFGRYGAIRQIRIGSSKETRGTAYVCYEDIYDAKSALEHLSGFNVQNRYLVVLYYNPAKRHGKADLDAKEQALRELQRSHGIHKE